MMYDRFLSLLYWLAEGRKMLPALVCVLVTVPIMLISCRDNSYATPPAAPFFPVQKEYDPTYTYPTALFEGKLVLDNCNLRLKPSWGKGDVWSKGDLPIWPYGYSLRIEDKVRIEDKEIQIIDNNGQVVARVGDKIKVGGGEVPAEIVEKYIGQPLLENSTGPYWLVSEVINN